MNNQIVMLILVKLYDTQVYANGPQLELVTFYYYSDRACDGHGSAAAVPRDTRPCVGIRYSLTGPRSCRNRRRRCRHYRYHHVCGSVFLPVGRSVGRWVGWSVSLSVGLLAGRTAHQLWVVQHLTAHAELSMWSDLPTMMAATDTTNIYSTATTIGARTRLASTLPPPHLFFLHRAPVEEAPHSRVVARTRPTHPACPLVGYLGAWTVFGVVFYYFYYYYLFICLFYYSYYFAPVEVCI